VDVSWIGRSPSGLLAVLTSSARTGFDSLRQITQQDPNITKELEIYVDGGARRGTDVLMALALGAKGVGLGRPFLFAQAAYGEKGVIRAVRSESLSFSGWLDTDF
jgi:isopentenyl diphosphate isomerase/L-lactate dehydrogenase-like FMN-dependent dehydrogenase